MPTYKNFHADGVDGPYRTLKAARAAADRWHAKYRQPGALVQIKVTHPSFAGTYVTKENVYGQYGTTRRTIPPPLAWQKKLLKKNPSIEGWTKAKAIRIRCNSRGVATHIDIEVPRGRTSNPSSTYKVIVGNVWHVLTTTNYKKALAGYKDYVKASKGFSEYSGDSVILEKDGKILKEYLG